MKRYAKILIVMLSLLIATAGCDGRTPILPGSDTIPLRVWVVLGPGETSGNRFNRGCRLTDAEVEEYVRFLKKHRWLFGWVQFEWDGYIEYPVDLGLINHPGRERDADSWHQTVVYSNWLWDYLNIYFTGNVQDAPGDLSWAMTYDPKAAQGDLLERPNILINDGGFNSASGYQVTTNLHVLEHEMTHYLARFTGRTFGEVPNQRTYNFQQTEHVPPGSWNILVPFAPPPCPLVIPGRYNQSGTEEWEIYERVHDGDWNNP